MNLIADLLTRMAYLLDAPEIQSFSTSAAAALLSAIWQSAVLAGSLALALKLAPRTTAAIRFALWLAALSITIALPLISPIMRDLAIQPIASAALPIGAKPMLNLDIRWSAAIVFVWAFASLYRIADLTRHTIRLRNLWKTATPIQNNSPAARHISSKVQLCVTNQVQRPSVIGFFSPRILIPEWLFAKLTPTELDQIILHETQHLRRFDDWTNLLQKLSLAVFPLNPVLVWIDRRLSTEREMACDEGVIRSTNAPRAYATCLTNLAEHSLIHHSQSTESALATLSLGAWQRRPELALRIHSILSRRPKLSPFASAALLTSMAAGLTVGSTELARCPQLIAFTQSPNNQPLATIAPRQSISRNGRLVNTAFESLTNPTNANFHPQLSVLKSVSLATKPLSTTKSARKSWNLQPAVVAHTPIAPAFTPLNISAIEPGSENLSEKISLGSAVTQLGQIAQLGQTDPAAKNEQHYIVLTTWEQVSTSSQQPEVTNTESRQTDHLNPPTIYQTTITRMVMRLIPASFSQTSPISQPSHSAWFVFKL